MNISEHYGFNLPSYSDTSDIEKLSDNFKTTDKELYRQKLIDDNLERDKVETSAFNAHKIASILDHPDNSVTDTKIGERSVGATKGLLQPLFTAIANVITAIVGGTEWNSVPDTTLKSAKLHMDSKINPHTTTAEQVGTYTKAAIDAKDKAINDAATAHYSDNDRHINSGERPKWNDKYTKSEVDNKFSMLETNTDWKESVATFADIAKTYPTPQDGWTVNTRDTDYTYRYSGTSWVIISANAIPKATASVDGLQTKENVADVNANTANRHNHNNKAVLDAITNALINTWNTVTEKLNLTGGTLTGFLTLHAAPTANMHAANKKYVDDIASGKGNGDMLKTVYDKNNDGIVDNAALLGGLASGEFCRINDARLSDTRPANGGTSTAAYKIVEADTRNDNQTPAWYMSNHGKTVVYEFKYTTAIGLKSSFSEVPIYGEMSTYTSWGDASGNRPVQLITCDTGLYFRTSASDAAWNAWQKIWTGTNNGGNANTLDNLDSTAFAKAKTITLAELNSTNLTSGIYNIEKISLSPVGLPGDHAHVFVGGDSRYQGQFDAQLSIPYYDGIMNGVWYRVANGVNYPVFRRIDDYSNLVNKPQSLPASDVYTWAKQPAKPSYTASEVSALPINGTAVAANSIDGGIY
ncbi:MAG: hypothetical protein RR234_06020 [Christensenella sp.]